MLLGAAQPADPLEQPIWLEDLASERFLQELALIRQLREFEQRWQGKVVQLSHKNPELDARGLVLGTIRPDVPFGPLTEGAGAAFGGWGQIRLRTSCSGLHCVGIGNVIGARELPQSEFCPYGCDDGYLGWTPEAEEEYEAFCPAHRAIERRVAYQMSCRGWDAGGGLTPEELDQLPAHTPLAKRWDGGVELQIPAEHVRGLVG